MDNAVELLKPETQAERISVVIFRLDRQTFALPIASIRQIIEMVTVTPVPLIKESVEGIINFHGTIVPVVNLRCYLSLPKIAPSLHTPIILVSIAERLIGLIVDHVLEVRHWLPEEIALPEEVFPEDMSKTRLLGGVVQSHDRVIILLDLNHLFSPMEAHFLGMTIDGMSHNIPADQLAPEVAVPQFNDEGNQELTQSAPDAG